MLRALLDFGNEHVLRPFDLELVRRSRVPDHVNGAQEAAKRIAFFHPPKCGGTSGRKWLASDFAGQPGSIRSRQRLQRTISGSPPPTSAKPSWLVFVQRQDTRFICGHFAYSRRAFADHEDQYDLITILRNPLSRVLSRFYFKGDQHHFPIDSELADWLQTDDAKAAARVFTAMFVGDIEVMTRLAHAGKPELNAAARQAIANLWRFTIGGRCDSSARSSRRSSAAMASAPASVMRATTPAIRASCSNHARCRSACGGCARKT